MICFVALPILLILGIFSAKYRAYAKESMECVFRTATLRPCNSNFDQKVKAKVVGKTFKHSPKLAKILSKNFVLISWFLVILSLFSLVGTGIGVYNYVVYGNCNGPDSTEFCIYDLAFGSDDTNACPQPKIVFDKDQGVIRNS